MGGGDFEITNNSELAVDIPSLMNHDRDNIYISCSYDQEKDGKSFHEIVVQDFTLNSFDEYFSKYL